MITFDINTGEFVEEKKPDPVMLSGEGPPSDIGNDGDFYIDTLTLELYGPKPWGAPVAMIGKDGLQGADGKDGLDGKNGIDGLSGMDGKDGEDGIGIPGLAGKDGREIELGTSATHFQWRYIGEEWVDLFPLPKNLTGDSGGGRLRFKDLRESLVAGSGVTITAVGKTLVIAATSTVTPAALTRTNDTNVTLTLGGTPTTALLQATSLTVGWSGTLAVSRGGSGAGTLTGLLLGNGTSAFTAITNSSTVGQCLRVTGASTYAWGALDLADTDAITGRLPFANLTQGSALSVLGVTGNATANVASIAAGTDNQVLRRSGTALTFGAVNLASANAVTGDLPFANIAQSSAASRLLGRGSAAGAGDFQEISLSGLSMIGTTLTYVAPDVSDYVHNPAQTSTDNAIARFNGTDGVNIQNSGVIISDTNAITGALNLTFSGGGATANEFSTDVLLAGDSDTAIPTEKAAKAYVDARALYKAAVTSRYYANHSTVQYPGVVSALGATGWVFFSAHNLSFPTTIGKVSFEVTTAVAASNGRVGIYSDVNGVPTTLLRDCGTISTATTGVKEITGLAQAVAAGRFWIGTQFESAISVRSWGTAVGHEINAEIGMAAFNNPITVNLDLTTTYAGGLPATATVSQFNGVDTVQTCWRS